MENKLKREYRFFLLTEYEKEEIFLRDKHRKGYKLVKVTLPGLYDFEKCEPEDVVYKLDFNPQSAENKQSYLQLYADYGWEYMQDLNEYSYFRKSASNSDNSETEIFNDDQSKLEMVKRIFFKKMVPLLGIFLLCGIPLAMSFTIGEFSDPWYVGTVVFWFITFSIYLAIFLKCGIGFYRLRKTYSHRVD